nr:zinc finger, CCHC-type [Tanacetum cinerariifolium]
MNSQTNKVKVVENNDAKVDLCDTIKLDRMDEINFTRWKEKIKFLLTAFKIQKHLRIEEETPIREKNLNGASSSKVNYVDSGKNNKGNDKKRKGHIKCYCKNPEKKNQNLNKKDESANAELHMASMITTNDWWYDSGATTHVCNNRDLFKTYKEIEYGHGVMMGDDHTSKVIGLGNVEIQLTSEKKLTLMNVLHVPNIRKNLVSGFKFCKSGVKVVIESDKVILSKANVFVGKAYACDGMFKLNINKITCSAYFLDCNFISSFNIEFSAFSLWHNRLGHINYRTMKDMLKQGITSYNGEHRDKFEIRVQAKMKRKHFPKVDRQSEILELVHYDICELNEQLTRGGNRYFITFIVDCSRYTYVYLLKSKDQAFETFKIYKAEVENQKGKKIQILKSNRGGEYFSIEFSSCCESQGLIHQRTTPYTPQKNGVVERKNKVLQDMINTMLVSANLPKNLWGEALLTTCHVSNRITAKKLKVSLYEVWKGRKHNISYFKVWGCLAYYKVPLPNTSKLGPRCLKSIFVGYAKDSKSCRCLDLDSDVIVESRYVDFFENKFHYDSTRTNEIVTQILQDISGPNLNSNNKRNMTESSSAPRRSERARKERNLDPDFIDSQTIIFLVKGDNENNEAIDDEMDFLVSNNTWELPYLPPGSKAIGCRWVFRIKYHIDGSIQSFKARLVIQGFSQRQGVDYFDTYALVARITSIMVLFALALIYNLLIHQMDVKTAFLNGDLDEEVYMKQPEGFVLPGHENKVCKSKKSLYGLKQAPKRWHDKFDKSILSNGFTHNSSDRCIYYEFTKEYGVILCLYVDDILIVGTDMNGINETKKFLSSCFQMKDMNEVDTILEIKEVNTLYESSCKLVENDGRAVAQIEYASAIGYSDASWITGSSDSKSTTGWIFTLGGGAVY